MKKFLTILFACILCTTYAQDAYHTKLLDSLNRGFSLPNTGKWAISNSEATTLGIATNYGGTTSNIAVTDAIFTTGQSRVITQGSNPWDAAHKYTNKSVIARGDRCLMVIWLRSTTPNARASVFIENATTYDKEIFATVSPTSKWKMYLAPFEAKTAYAIDALSLGLHLAGATQTIEVGGMAFLNYEKNIIFNQLPLDLDVGKYGGSEADAPWRKEAEQSIEQLRKANFTVKVTTPTGQAVSGAEVRFEMLQHEFKFGTAVASNRFNGGTALTPTYEQRILDLDGKGHGFNEVVFENDMKWPAWEQNWFSSHSEIVQDVAFLKNKNISVRGHTLVWPGWQYSPTNINANTSPDVLKQRIRDHIKTISSFQGIGQECIDWDVLNEITTNNDYANRMAGSPGYTTGRELYAEIFKQADSLLPKAKLYINDYIAIEAGDGSPNNINTWKQRIDEIIAKGGPIDGIGFQGHFSSAPTSIPRVKAILDEFWNKYKFEAKVTEYDISRLVAPALQADYMRDILSITFAHPSMKGFIMWGFWDGAHWLDNAPIYNRDWSIKPSGTAFIDQVFTKWWTDTKVNSTATGEATARAFKGKYRITVKLPDGKVVFQVVDLDKDKTVNINTNGAVSTQDFNMNFDLSISPNPAYSPATITWNNTLLDETAQVDIRNSLGVSVFSKKIKPFENNLVLTDFNQAKGMYFVTLKTNKGSQTMKLIIP